jgi:hypothetical protein
MRVPQTGASIVQKHALTRESTNKPAGAKQTYEQVDQHAQKSQTTKNEQTNRRTDEQMNRRTGVQAYRYANISIGLNMGFGVFGKHERARWLLFELAFETQSVALPTTKNARKDKNTKRTYIHAQELTQRRKEVKQTKQTNNEQTNERVNEQQMNPRWKPRWNHRTTDRRTNYVCLLFDMLAHM